MDLEPTTCRIRVRWQNGEIPSDFAIRSLKDIKELPNVTEKLRQQWATEIVKSLTSSPSPVATIRPWDILLHQDGSVITWSSEKKGESLYPARCRIPSCNVQGLEEGEKVKRAEKFALGSLLYEVMTANQPFEELSDDRVQDLYSRGSFPDDVFSMPMGPSILGCWCLEFEKEMEELIAKASKIPPGERFRAYAKAHPFLLASQLIGGVLMTGSVVALPVLGLAGFAATGPVADTAAAAWQSSLGIVQAGSLFSWCQSAAMGGAAVDGIIAGGAAGGGVALAATGGALASGPMALTPEKLKEMFLAVYRKEDKGVELIWDAENSISQG